MYQILGITSQLRVPGRSCVIMYVQTMSYDRDTYDMILMIGIRWLLAKSLLWLTEHKLAMLIVLTLTLAILCR